MSERELVPYHALPPVRPSRVELADDGEPIFIYTHDDYERANADFRRQYSMDEVESVTTLPQGQTSGTSAKGKSRLDSNDNVGDREENETIQPDNRSFKRKLGKVTVSYVAPTMFVASVLYGGTLAALGDRDAASVQSAVSSDVTLENVMDGYQHAGKLAKTIIGFVS